MAKKKNCEEDFLGFLGLNKCQKKELEAILIKNEYIRNNKIQEHLKLIEKIKNFKGGKIKMTLRELEVIREVLGDRARKVTCNNAIIIFREHMAKNKKRSSAQGSN